MGIRRPDLSSVVASLRKDNFKLLQTDKEGGFVMMTSRVYNEKAGRALHSNFRSAENFHPAKAKKEALKAITADKIYSSFCTNFPGLSFTKELPEGKKLRFLDLTIHLDDRHTCWIYTPRSKKGLLPFPSHHLKLVKRAITLTAMRNALGRSCPHQVASSCALQVERLATAGFPEPFLVGLAEVVLRESRSQGKEAPPQVDKAKVSIIPYLHGVSHRVKKAAGRAGFIAQFGTWLQRADLAVTNCSSPVLLTAPICIDTHLCHQPCFNGDITSIVSRSTTLWATTATLEDIKTTEFLCSFSGHGGAATMRSLSHPILLFVQVITAMVS
ncbi:hypothetical protein HPB52_014188 [Rhipicephalus sanguineus]|uniref:Tick transposon n=1 Tax=Rhipicephalus sanguineus TaxID=34632 RepID=A0A9D4T5P3_RHISA|nr:hypothetical protein HPB52_014188 [Rhipicephalus sanguineus]